MLKKYRIQKILKNYIVLDKSGKSDLLRQLSLYSPVSLSLILESFSRGEILQADARDLLSALYTHKYLNDYIALLLNPRFKIRDLVKDVIRKKGGKQAVSGLLENFDHPEPSVRSSVTELLKEYLDDGVVSKISTFLKSESSDVVSNAVELLGKTGGPEALKHLVPFLQSGDLQLKRKIVRSLSGRGEKGAIQPLTDLLRKENDHHLLKMILDFFAGTLNRGADEEIISAVRFHLTSEDLLIRQKAVDVLGKIATAAIIPDILALLKGSDVNIRRSVVDILNMIKDPRVGETLIHCIQDRDWWVREIASEALLGISEESSTIKQDLLKLLSSGDENTRRTVAEYFNQVLYPPAYQPLLKLLDDGDWWVREKAVSALGKMGNPEAVPHILAHTGDAEIKGAIPEALRSIGSEEALSALLSLLATDDKVIRLAALKALKGFDNPEVVIAIKRAALDSVAEISEMALNILEERGGKRVSIYDIQLEVSSMVNSDENCQDVQEKNGEEVGFSGNLSLFSLGEVVQNLQSGCKSGCLKLFRGKIYFEGGQITHSEVSGDEQLLKVGEEAVYDLFRLNKGPFKFLVGRKPEKVTVTEPTMSVVLEAARRADEKKR